mmetsp:Transcript_4940/g.4078  ORF Transcript_4940/g.4078 Transcript_4940/m.4078 type:complete len:147 (-) Transcript_4940:143-583(-)
MPSGHSVLSIAMWVTIMLDIAYRVRQAEPGYSVSGSWVAKLKTFYQNGHFLPTTFAISEDHFVIMKWATGYEMTRLYSVNTCSDCIRFIAHTDTSKILLALKFIRNIATRSWPVMYKKRLEKDDTDKSITLHTYKKHNEVPHQGFN